MSTQYGFIFTKLQNSLTLTNEFILKKCILAQTKKIGFYL